MNIPVAYEDDWLLVVNKPAGLLSVPTPRKETRTLTSILNEDAQARILKYRLHPCHRLDRETCGLVIYAKGPSIQKKMMDIFRARKVDKKYLAFVHGRLPNASGEISRPIEGKSAVTQYRVVKAKSNYSVVEAMPLTGRTNQIRIHFKSIGHPLVGEDKFAFRRDFALRFKHICLEARELNFIHPVTGKHVRIVIDLAQDLKDFLAAHD